MAGRRFPFILMEDPWEYCDCFCAPLLGQNGSLYAGILQFLNISDVREWLQPYWTSALQEPDLVGTIVEEIKSRFRPFLLLGKWVWPLWQWLGRLFSQKITAQIIRASGISVYQHRIENQGQLETARKLGYGGEMDLAFTKDGKWVVYHEQAWHGIDIVELDYKFLEREKVPLFSALRSANSAVILDIKSNHYHPNLKLGDDAIQGLLVAVSQFGGDSHLITIASMNRGFLQKVEERVHEQGLHCQICLTVVEFDVLLGLVEEWKRNSKPFPFMVLSLYGSHYRRLVQQFIARGDEVTLALFLQRFRIIIAENALDSLEALNFDSLVTHAGKGG